jgi:[protein-PII] uridylyltransferase
MQYDLFHIYTVDEHTLMVIRNLRRMTVPTFAHELPHCSEIIQQIPKQELLYLAGLFHDIAKGRGGDHSKLGAMDAEQFCQLHRLGQYDTKLVTWIIRSHLIMSSTAQRKDISDPDVVLEFANIVGDVNHLNYLYLLTIADIRATDPKLWNSWKDSLLKELYHKTKIALQQDPGKLINRNELIQDTKNSALAYLHDYKISEKEAFEFWQQASSDYFVSYSGEEIAWQLSSILNNENVEHVPQVYLRKHPRRASTELFIYTHDSDALFSVTASVINSIGLSILDARIITTKNNYTLNSFLIIEDDGIAITEHTREQQIITKMLEHLTPPISPPIKSSQKLPRQIKNFPITTQISFSNDPKEHFTIVDLITSDKPGLLSRVGLALVQCNINLHNAKIHTIGARAEDSFYITDKTGKILETEAQFNCLKTTILDCIQIEN